MRHAQAVLVVVTNDVGPGWPNACKRVVRSSRRGGFIRMTGMDRLAVLGANPVCDERDVGKGNNLREGQEATNGPTPPSPRFQGSCS